MGLNDNTKNIELAINEQNNIQLTAKQQKLHKDNLSKALDLYFYNYFLQHQGNAENCFLELKNIDTRYNIICYIADNRKEKNELDKTLLNEIYEKEAKKIYNIFKNNDEYIETKQQKELEKEAEIIQQQEAERIRKEQEKKQKEQKATFILTTIIKILIIFPLKCLFVLIAAGLLSTKTTKRRR